MEFSYKIEEKSDRVMLHIAGNLIEKSQALEMMERVDELSAHHSVNIIIDMAGFRYMNSTGLNVLIQILTKTRKSGGDAVLCCVPDNIKSLMLITKLNNVFTIAENEAAAGKALAKTV